MNEQNKPEPVSFGSIVENLERHIEHLKEEGVSYVELSSGGRVKMDSLAKIADEIAGCEKCALHQTRKNTVPGMGCLNPDIMFIGEAPGADEDAVGRPFVGAAGQILTRLINKLGYTRENIFIGNILKCRPPNNRNPLPDEIEVCIPYLRRQIAIIQPKVIVALGAVAAKTLTGLGTGISRMRGQWFMFEGVPLMPTFHPSYLLRNRQKETYFMVWEDMLQVLARLGKEPPADK